MDDDPAVLVKDLQDRFPKAHLIGGDADFEQLVARVIGFVEAPAIGLDLPLDLQGTAFQERVWQALRKIPVGTTLSYAAIAARIGALGPYAPWPVHAPPTGWPWQCPATAWCARMAPCPAIAGASSASASCCDGKRHWLISKRMAQVASKPLSTDRGQPPSHFFDFPGLPGSVSSGSAPPAIAHRYRLAVLP